MPALKSQFVGKLVTAALVGTASGAAMAQGLRSASVEVGAGESVGMVRLSVQGALPYRWFEGDGKHLRTYWDASLGHWRGTRFNNVAGARQPINDIGFTPVLRYMADSGRGWYVEGGIGVHLLSQLYNNNENKLSTAFQFGDHLGGGYVYANGWDLGVRLQHYSNGSVKKPNDGENFVVLRLGRPF